MSEHGSLFLGGLSYALFGILIFTTLSWPSENSLVLNQTFWSGLLLFTLSIGVIFVLFHIRGGSTRNVRFIMGLLLIVDAAVTNLLLEQIVKNNNFWAAHLPHSFLDFLVWIQIVTAYTKDIVGFGIAALGANIAASAILEKT